MRIMVCDRCQERCASYVRVTGERRMEATYGYGVDLASPTDPGPVDLCGACAQHVWEVARGRR